MQEHEEFEAIATREGWLHSDWKLMRMDGLPVRYLDANLQKRWEGWQARAATDEEPILLKAGDRRVLINGKPPLVDCRIVAESVYQRLARRTRLWQKFGM